MELKRYEDFLILESKKKMSDEDIKSVKSINSQRSKLKGYNGGDDCPLGSPYGGYSVSDTRSALTQMKKRIDDKYKTEDDWNKESDKRAKLMQDRNTMRTMYESYIKAVKNSLSSKDRISQDLFEEQKSLSYQRPSAGQLRYMGIDDKNKAKSIWNKTKAKFNSKVEKAGLKSSHLKDIVKDKMYDFGIVTKADFERALKNLNSDKPKNQWPQFYTFILKAPGLEKYMEPFKGAVAVIKFKL